MLRAGIAPLYLVAAYLSTPGRCAAAANPAAPCQPLHGEVWPHGDILIVFPWQAKQQRVVWSVALQLKEKGKLVRVMTKELPCAGR